MAARPDTPLTRLWRRSGRVYHLLTAGEAFPDRRVELPDDHLPGAGDGEPAEHTQLHAELEHRSDDAGWLALSTEQRRALLMGTFDAVVDAQQHRRRRALVLFAGWIVAVSLTQLLAARFEPNAAMFALAVVLRTGSTLLAGTSLSNFLVLRVGGRVQLEDGFAGYRSLGAVGSRRQFAELVEQCLQRTGYNSIFEELVPRADVHGGARVAPAVQYAREWLAQHDPAALPAAVVRNAVLFEAGLGAWVGERVGERNVVVALRLAKRHRGTLGDVVSLVDRL